jgi:broad specificity phosphatase PhoE
MTTVYLIRHGAYENPENILHLRLPGFPLSAAGKKQAAAQAHALADVPVVAVYASPLTRAIQTARILAAPHAITPVTDDRLLDTKSPLQGAPVAYMETIGWNFYTRDLIRRGGETLEDITARMTSFLDEKLKIHPDGNLIVVSHGDPVMCLALSVQGIETTFAAVRNPPYVPLTGGFILEFVGSAAVPARCVRVHPLPVFPRN